MKLEDALSILRRVNRALENMNAYLSHHMDDDEGALKRKHTRFEKDGMLARFALIDHPRYKEKVFQAKLFDISAEGMCLDVHHEIKIQLRDQFQFSVYKNGSNKLVVKGIGKVVRVRDKRDYLRVGVDFVGVVHK